MTHVFESVSLQDDDVCESQHSHSSPSSHDMILREKEIYLKKYECGQRYGRLQVLLVGTLLTAVCIVSLLFDWNILLGAIILLYFCVQTMSASYNHYTMTHLAKRDNDTAAASNEKPKVGIVIVGYRENPDYWRRSLESLLEFSGRTQFCTITTILACIDGNDETYDAPMKTQFDTIFQKSSSFSCTTACYLLPHGGKRHAMVKGFEFLRPYECEYVLVMDSDTYVRSEHAFDELTRCIHHDAQNGCATSLIRVFNYNDSLLSRIISARYAYAFMIERGALSTWKCMTCCSGPFSIYRMKYLTQPLLDDFLNQQYCHENVGPGDDRHLTLLMLLQGYWSRQTSRAIAYTETPSTLFRFLQQQLRWARSFYREQWYQIGACGHHSWYLTCVTIYEWILPFFIILGFLPIFPLTPSMLLRRLMIMAFILILRTFLLCWFYKWKLSVWYNLCMGFVFFHCLLPLRLYALTTLHIQNWVTSVRSLPAASWKYSQLCSIDSIGMMTFIGIWNMLVLGNIVYLIFHFPTSEWTFSSFLRNPF